MKKIEKLFEGRLLKATKGTVGRYDYSESVVRAYEINGKTSFKMTTDSKRGRDEIVSTDLNAILKGMREYAPKAAQWKVLKKVVK